MLPMHIGGRDLQTDLQNEVKSIFHANKAPRLAPVLATFVPLTGSLLTALYSSATRPRPPKSPEPYGAVIETL
jgi:hypothetical protein